MVSYIRYYPMRSELFDSRIIAAQRTLQYAAFSDTRTAWFISHRNINNQHLLLVVLTGKWIYKNRFGGIRQCVTHPSMLQEYYRFCITSYLAYLIGIRYR